MWSDNETNIDLINVQHLVAAVVGIVRSPDLLPATVGVFGAWGSGKSSIMKMVYEQLSKEDGVHCVAFNGWLFEGYDDAKAALMDTILDELKDKLPRGEKAKNLVKRLAKRINWFRLLGFAGKNLLSFTLTGLPTPDTATALLRGVDLKNLDKLIKETSEGEENIRRTIHQFRDDFAELVQESKVETLVVLIDDLDRCLPDTIIKTLEAIRLFLFVPGTAFVIGADEGLVQHAVKHRFPEVEDSKLDVGQQYLEKLVQYPVRIPPLSRSEVETYINLLFAKKHLDKDQFQSLTEELLKRPPATIFDTGFNQQNAFDYLETVPPKLQDDLILTSQIADVLTNIHEGNPRQVKRFLNSLLLRISMAATRDVELKMRVLAKLMLLEEFKHQSFRLLAQWQAEQEGKPHEIRALEASLSQKTTDQQGETEASTDMEVSENGEEVSLQPEVVPDNVQPWLEEGWHRDWLLLDPPLSDVDLRPYFYFAREELGALKGTARRLSRNAKEILEHFLSGSHARSNLAKDKAKTLSPAEAANMFQALTERVLRSEDLSADDSPLRPFFDLVEARSPELLSEAIAFLGRLPTTRVPVSLPTRIDRITRDTSSSAVARTLLHDWSTQQDNPQLAKAAEQITRRAN